MRKHGFHFLALQLKKENVLSLLSFDHSSCADHKSICHPKLLPSCEEATAKGGHCVLLSRSRLQKEVYLKNIGPSNNGRNRY